MEKIMAVYDVDATYAQRLADVVNQKEKAPFMVVPFTSLEALKDYGSRHTIEILLVGSDVLQKQIEEIDARTVITLAEGEVVSVTGSYPRVYKYQSADALVREVMACYCERPQSQFVTIGRRAKVFGIYSPISRCLKTSLALTMGQHLAREHKVIYISFETFAGFGQLISDECKGDLSDVLYFFRQDNFGVMRLKSMVYSWKDMEYIPPVRYPQDLEQLTGEEAAFLVERIASECGYDYVMADVGQALCNVIPVLEACDIVYMPVKEDCVSSAKLEEFEEYLHLSGQADLLQRIHKAKLPYHSSFGRRETYMEQLLWGELGDYVRKLLKGTGGLA